MNNIDETSVGTQQSGNHLIAALRPYDCTLEIELFPIKSNARVSYTITERDDETVICCGALKAGENRVWISRLINYVEYLVTVESSDGKSQTRPFRCGYIPGKIVAYCHPDDTVYRPSGNFLGSPSIVRLLDGTLLESHDIFAPDGTRDTSLFYRSQDKGESWTYCSKLVGAFWGKLFLHRGRLFYLCLEKSYGALLLYETLDSGNNWSVPVQLMAGGNHKKGGPHRAPGQLVAYGGRIWAALEYGSWESGGHAAGAISFSEDSEPMDSSQWVCTGFLQYDASWPGTSIGENEKYLEGNMVVSPEGRLIDFLRYQCRRATPSHGRAILLEVDPKAPQNLPRYFTTVDFPGNASKFSIQWDAVSCRYWALCSRIVTDVLEQRNLLSLVSSPDLIHWKLDRDIINYTDNNWWEDESKTGFQYPDWIIDGEDILFLSRTAINCAVRYHDSNYITFHRIRNFRR